MKLLIKTILVVSKLFGLFTYCLSFKKPAPPPAVEYPNYAETDAIICTFGSGPGIAEAFFMLFLFIGLPLALAFGALLFLSPANKPCVKTPATLKLNQPDHSYLQ